MSAKAFEPVRIGVVGLGRFGHLHARTLAGLAEAKLVALVDQDEAALAKACSEIPGVQSWVDIDQALAQAGAEAWVVATRTPSHVAVAERILSAGAAALVEKPLAESVAEARRLAPLVAPDSRNLMLGHILLFATEFRQLLREVERRGRPVYFQALRHRPIRTNELYPEETPLSLLMVHDLYLAFALMNGEEPSALRGRLHRRADGVYDIGCAELEWANGTWGSLTASYLTPPGMSEQGFDRLEVFGPGWAARMQIVPSQPEVWAERAEWPIALNIDADPAAPAGWLAEELRCFSRVVRGSRGAAVPVGARYADAVRMMEWLAKLESDKK
jgi:predicted dehydrogenase